MATKKKALKKSGSLAGAALKTAAKLPAGFTAVATGGGSAWHDWNMQSILTGKVVSQGSFKGEYGVQKTITVKQANGVEVTVSESGGLKNLFVQAKKGKTVYIEFLGVLKLKGKKTYKTFAAAIK